MGVLVKALAGHQVEEVVDDHNEADDEWRGSLRRW
jgi:hypothetical protein